MQRIGDDTEAGEAAVAEDEQGLTDEGHAEHGAEYALDCRGPLPARTARRR